MTVVEALDCLVHHGDLTEDEIGAVMTDLVEGRATPAQIGGFLVGLRVKGETATELAGAARVMRAHAIRIQPRAAAVLDTCGTGGDRSGTFNISTAAALVAAAAGAVVAKHGNRAMSGHVGAADVLEALGVRIDLPPEQVTECIDQVGIGFLFAQALHPAMKHAAAPRRELGIRTLFNLLGPLSNPAGATHQLLGVFAAEWVEPVAVALGRLGTQHALVVHGAGGLDEISLEGPTEVAEMRVGDMHRYRIEPEQFGFGRCQRTDLCAGSPEESAAMIRSVLAGDRGAAADVVLLNAGAALYAADRAPTITAGIDAAKKAIDSGAAQRILAELAAFTTR